MDPRTHSDDVGAPGRLEELRLDLIDLADAVGAQHLSRRPDRCDATPVEQQHLVGEAGRQLELVRDHQGRTPGRVHLEPALQPLEEMQAMVGDRTGETFRIGDDVSVRLLEVAPVAGALRFELLSEGSRGDPSSGGRGRKGPSSSRGKAGAYRKFAKKKR